MASKLKTRACHPYQYAHQLGLKISECVAVVDGLKPSLDHLTRLIWANQRHLLSWQTLQEGSSPYDEYDLLDKQIVKTIVEIKTSEPHLTSSQLESRVVENFTSLSEIPAFASQETLLSTIAALIAEKLYSGSRLHTSLPPDQKQTLLQFIEEHIELCRASTPKMALSDLVRRILSLYLLATQLPRDTDEAEVHQMIQLGKPAGDQALCAFLAAEMVLRRGIETSEEEIVAGIMSAYNDAINLPIFSPDELEVIEIAVWRRVSDKEGLLSILPYRIGQRIETEIALQLIDDPKQTFSSLVHNTYQVFHKMREVLSARKPEEIMRKIQIWCAQGDLLFRSIRFDRDKPLLRLIIKMAEELPRSGFYHRDFVSRVCETYLRDHSSLGYYANQVYARAFSLYKYVWFTHFSQKGESGIDRCIAWHAASFDFSQGKSPFILSMQTLFSEQFPFLPFDPKVCEKYIQA